MPNPLKHAQEVNAFSEVYEVVRTAVVVLDEQTYRIDVLKGYATPDARYIARCSVQQHVTVSLTAPDTPRKGARKDERVTVWVEYPFPSPVEGKGPKTTLTQALACLAEQRAAVPT
jgi:hypothetical protein